MPTEVRIVVLLFHLLAMLFMAAPLYALLAVNERGRFTVPPNYNTDRYLENILKNQMTGNTGSIERRYGCCLACVSPVTLKPI